MTTPKQNYPTKYPPTSAGEHYTCPHCSFRGTKAEAIRHLPTCVAGKLKVSEETLRQSNAHECKWGEDGVCIRCGIKGPSL